MQGVVVKSEVDEETFQLAKDITQESSLYITGTITEDNRSDLGYEMQVKSIEIVHETRLSYYTKESWNRIFNGSSSLMVTFKNNMLS